MELKKSLLNAMLVGLTLSMSSCGMFDTLEDNIQATEDSEEEKCDNTWQNCPDCGMG